MKRIPDFIRRFAKTVTLIILFLSVHLSAAELIKDKDLVSAVADGDAKEFQSALEYIKLNHPDTLPGKLIEEYLDDDDEDARERIISALKEYPLPEQSALWIKILRSTKEKRTEIALIEFLSRSKVHSFTIPIAEKLLVPRSEVREKAATMLRQFGDDRMLPVILSLGQSKNPIDRIYFLEALNYLYDVRFQKLAISMLEDENKSVRIYAIRCINNNDVKEALPALRKLTAKDDNNETRKMGIESLVSFKDSGSGPMLTGILKNENSEMRIEAVKALKELKYYPAAAPISEMLLNEENQEIKLAALETLISFKKAGNINGIKHIIKNDKDPKMRIKAVYAIGAVIEENSSREILKEAALDEDYRVRGEACSVMGSFKKNGMSDFLINRIKTDKSRYVRTAALYSIVKINDSKNVIRIFDIYSFEDDRVFKEILREIIRNNLKRYIR